MDLPPPLGGAVKQTRWTVITGAPCSGKTSVIRVLEKRGLPVVHEVARSFIDRQLARGLSMARIKADPVSFEQGILAEKLAIEASLPPDRGVFLDRGVPDSIAYFRFEGLDTRAPVAASRIRRYRRVFLLDRLAMAPDPVRTEDEAAAVRLEALLIESYRRLGYLLIRIPAVSLQERVEQVLQAC